MSNSPVVGDGRQTFSNNQYTPFQEKYEKKRRRQLSGKHSVYTNMAHSGFQNAKQEHYYNKLIQKLIQLLQNRVLQFYNGRKLVPLKISQSNLKSSLYQFINSFIEKFFFDSQQLFTLQAEPTDDKQFQYKIIKLAKVMEQCEKYNKQDELFSLHFNELAEFCRDKVSGAQDLVLSASNFQNPQNQGNNQEYTHKKDANQMLQIRDSPKSPQILNYRLNQPSDSAFMNKDFPQLTSKGSLLTGIGAFDHFYNTKGEAFMNKSLVGNRNIGKSSQKSVQDLGDMMPKYFGQEEIDHQGINVMHHQRPKSSEVYKPRQNDMSIGLSRNVGFNQDLNEISSHIAQMKVNTRSEQEAPFDAALHMGSQYQQFTQSKKSQIVKNCSDTLSGINLPQNDIQAEEKHRQFRKVINKQTNEFLIRSECKDQLQGKIDDNSTRRSKFFLIESDEKQRPRLIHKFSSGVQGNQQQALGTQTGLASGAALGGIHSSIESRGYNQTTSAQIKEQEIESSKETEGFNDRQIEQQQSHPQTQSRASLKAAKQRKLYRQKQHENRSDILDSNSLLQASSAGFVSSTKLIDKALARRGTTGADPASSGPQNYEINNLDNQRLNGILPKQVINRLGLNKHNYVIYEKQGVDGKVHRNFVTVDEHGNQMVPQSMKNIQGQNYFPSRSGSRSKSTTRRAAAQIPKKRRIITSDTLKNYNDKYSRVHLRLLNDVKMGKKQDLLAAQQKKQKTDPTKSESIRNVTVSKQRLQNRRTEMEKPTVLGGADSDGKIDFGLEKRGSSLDGWDESQPDTDVQDSKPKENVKGDSLNINQLKSKKMIQRKKIVLNNRFSSISKALDRQNKQNSLLLQQFMNQHAPDLYNKKHVKQGLKSNPRKGQYLKYLGEKQSNDKGFGAVLQKKHHQTNRPKSSGGGGATQNFQKMSSKVRYQSNKWEQVQAIQPDIICNPQKIDLYENEDCQLNQNSANVSENCNPEEQQNDQQEISYGNQLNPVADKFDVGTPTDTLQYQEQNPTSVTFSKINLSNPSTSKGVSLNNSKLIDLKNQLSKTRYDEACPQSFVQKVSAEAINPVQNNLTFEINRPVYPQEISDLDQDLQERIAQELQKLDQQDRQQLQFYPEQTCSPKNRYTSANQNPGISLKIPKTSTVAEGLRHISFADAQNIYGDDSREEFSNNEDNKNYSNNDRDANIFKDEEAQKLAQLEPALPNQLQSKPKDLPPKNCDATLTQNKRFQATLNEGKDYKFTAKNSVVPADAQTEMQNSRRTPTEVHSNDLNYSYQQNKKRQGGQPTQFLKRSGQQQNQMVQQQPSTQSIGRQNSFNQLHQNSNFSSNNAHQMMNSQDMMPTTENAHLPDENIVKSLFNEHVADENIALNDHSISSSHGLNKLKKSSITESQPLQQDCFDQTDLVKSKKSSRQQLKTSGQFTQDQHSAIESRSTEKVEFHKSIKKQRQTDNEISRTIPYNLSSLPDPPRETQKIDQVASQTDTTTFLDGNNKLLQSSYKHESDVHIDERVKKQNEVQFGAVSQDQELKEVATKKTPSANGGPWVNKEGSGFRRVSSSQQLIEDNQMAEGMGARENGPDEAIMKRLVESTQAISTQNDEVANANFAIANFEKSIVQSEQDQAF